MAELQAEERLTLKRAKSAVMARDYVLAESLYKKLLQNDADNVEFLGALANVYVKSGRNSDALSIYSRMLKINDKDVDVINNLGSIYRRLKRYRESIDILSKGIIVDESNVQLFYNLGFTYKDAGEYENAVRCFQMVIEKNPTDVLAYNHLGSIYLKEKQYDKAVTVFQKGLKIDPNHPVLHLNLAHTYEGLNDVAKASKSYEQALRSKPGWLEAMDGYADILLAKSRLLQAKGVVEQAIELSPNDAYMHTKIGRIFFMQEDYDEAKNAFNDALRLKPENIEALSGFADACEANGEILEALHAMEKYEELNPDSISMLQQYTHILLSGSKFDEAHEKMQQAYEKNPDDVKTLNLMGQYYICTDDESKADGCFERIQEIDPSYREFYRDGALRYAQLGKNEKAEEQLLKYLEGKPEDARAMAMLAASYEAQHRYDDALNVYLKLNEEYGGSVRYKKGLERVNDIIASQPKPVESPAAVEEAAPDVPLEEKTEDLGTVDVSSEEPKDMEIPEEPFSFGKDTFEKLSEDSDGISPFANELLDDEALDDGSPVSSLDSLLPEDEDGELPRFEEENIGSKEEDEPIELEEEPLEAEKEKPRKAKKAPEEKKAEKRKLEKTEPEPEAEEVQVVEEEGMEDLYALPEKREEPEELEELEEAPEELKEVPTEREAVSLETEESEASPIAEMIDAINDKDAAEKYKASAALFIRLRSMVEFLPQKEKDDFFHSRERIKLEYIIARLTGKPGLLAVSEVCHSDDALSNPLDAQASVEGKQGTQLAASVFAYMRSLVRELPDEGLATALDKEVAEVLEKITV